MTSLVAMLEYFRPRTIILLMLGLLLLTGMTRRPDDILLTVSSPTNEFVGVISRRDTHSTNPYVYNVHILNKEEGVISASELSSKYLVFEGAVYGCIDLTWTSQTSIRIDFARGPFSRVVDIIQLEGNLITVAGDERPRSSFESCF